MPLQIIEVYQHFGYSTVTVLANITVIPCYIRNYKIIFLRDAGLEPIYFQNP